jgi:molybdopterin molybdochelatase
MDADTSYLAAGEDVTVTLFSPAVRPPTLLGVGEDDPALNRLLDHVGRPRYLPVGSREGLRRLRNGLPDVAVTAGPVTRDVEVTVLGGWEREWGLIVPEAIPNLSMVSPISSTVISGSSIGRPTPGFEPAWATQSRRWPTSGTVTDAN